MQNPIRSKSKVTVTNLNDGSPRDRGWCEYRVRLLGIQPVVTPTGAYDRYIVRTHRLITLNMANASVTTLTAYVPQHGWRGEKITKVTQPMNLFEIQQTESLTVLEPIAPETP